MSSTKADLGCGRLGMTYNAAKDSSDRVAKVIYQSKDAKTTKTFDALDWLAQLVSHIPNKGEQMVRYYGFYSNKSRGLRKKAGTEEGCKHVKKETI